MFKLTNLILLLSIFCVVAIAAPYQELPPKPGYVPVYIREGNMPLSQVNPKLVEAFHEDEESNQLQIAAKTPKGVKVANVEKPNEAVENIQQDEEETKDETKQLNKAIYNNREEEKSQKQEREERPASDIAEFTSDDIKTLADDKIDY